VNVEPPQDEYTILMGWNRSDVESSLVCNAAGHVNCHAWWIADGFDLSERPVDKDV
jgi:hypothetical protein